MLGITTLLAGCVVDPPATFDVGLGPAVGKYATLAFCHPAQPCPGTACPENAVGAPNAATVAPDDALVDLQQCLTLTTVLGGGTVKSEPGLPSIRIHLGGLGGRTIVKASQDGAAWKEVGFIVTAVQFLPRTAHTDCMASLGGAGSQQHADIYLSRCNTMDNVAYLQIIHDNTSGLAGGASIDAVEGLTFAPIKLPP